MEPDIRNFKGLEDLIRKRPKEADKLAAEWDRFVKIHPQDRMFFTTRERFFAWAEKHPQLHIDTSIWVGKEVIEAYSYVREQREERQELDKQLGLPAGPSPFTLADFATLPFLAAMYLNKPKIMQDDEDYRAILERKKQEWLEKNPGKDFTSKEGLDYLYGSLENSDKPPIDQETEEEFRANKKFAGKVKRYDKEKAKIYKNPDDDPQLRRLKAEIDEHAQARFAHLQKINPAYKLEDVRRSVERRSYLMFAYQYEDKAKQYAQSNDRIKAALDIKETEQMASTGGRQIRVAERTHPAYSGISQEEIERRLQQALSQQPTAPSGGLVMPSGQPIPSGDGGGGEQPQQSSQPQGGGGHGGRSRGMDLANRLLPKKKKPPLPKKPSALNPLNNLRNKLLIQFIRTLLAFLISSTPILLVILILTGTFVIVGFAPFDIKMPNLPSPITPGGGGSSTLPSLPPGTIPGDTKQKIVDLLKNNISNLDVYKRASSETGISWEILAGIHYLEGSFGPNQSLVSGRAIGANEPDVRSCSNTGGLGIPIPLSSGGCGFNSLLDSAVYAGNHLKAKIRGGVPQGFEDLVKALSRYNGGGNSNCDDNPPYQRRSPYTGCPRQFEGEDDAYVMNFFDSRHAIMYIIYCGDRTKCSTPQVFQRPGVATVIKIISENFNQ